MLKLFFIPLIILLVMDGPVRGVMDSINIPYVHWIMGWISYLGKGWIQAIPCLGLLIAGLVVKKGTKMEEAGKKGLYAIVLAGILGQMIKHLIGRPRPRVMDAMGLSIGPSLAGGFDSFPSGHAASAFALAAALSFFYPRVRIPLYLYAVIVSISRIYIDAHFLSDVFGGIALGLWIGSVVTTKGREDIKRIMTGPGVILGIVALSLFLFFYKLGSPSLFDVDEAVYAESAREMVETGDWITPQYNYTNRYDKPVLFYWLITSAYGLFGVNEFAARFWSAVFGIVLVLFTYYFTRSIGGPIGSPAKGSMGSKRWAILSALILTTSLEMVVLSHAAITDMTLTLFITATLFCFFLGYTDSGGNKKWWYRGLYLSISLSVLTKGPVGIVIPVLIIFLFLLLRGEMISRLREMEILQGGGIFLIVAIPWYVIEIWINGWEYIDAFFLKHNITRYTGVISGHSGPVYYFIPVVLLAFFPWSAFLPYGLIKSFQMTRLRENLSYKDAAGIFSAIWFIVVFVFFSFSKTKLPGYIAPISPAIALLVGRVWDESLSSPSKTDKWMKLSAVFCLFSGLILGAGLISLPKILEASRFYSQFLYGSLEETGGFYLLGGGIIAGVSFSMFALWRHYKAISFGIMVGMITVITYILLNRIVPLADMYLQAPLRDYARIASAEIERTGGDLIVYGLNKPSIVFYARGPALVFSGNQQDKLEEIIASSKKAFIITNSSRTDGLLNNPALFLISRRGAYALLSNQPPGGDTNQVSSHALHGGG